MSKLGVVIIGRNEGERLVRCIRSVVGVAETVVYVDSGSTDRSVEAARELGVEALLLDTSVPFTAARARNVGFRHLVQRHPEVEFVQFVDGDCEVAPDWLGRARRELADRPDAGVVCGRRRERYPERSVYNRLCDMEWDTPVGEAAACGGDAMMRVAPLVEVGGYRDSLIAGEEPELCTRLRAGGWKVLRVDAEMTVHDAAMTRFGQWWRRALRAGHAYAEVSRLRRNEPDRYAGRQFRSNWVWGALVPLAALVAVPFFPGAALVALAAYALLCVRIYRHRRRRGDPPRHARLYAAFTVMAKFPLALGQAQYYRNRLFGRQQTLIEYKSADPSAAPVRVAYLVNQYPHVSHSFIRREIRGAEEHGLDVLRISIRRSSAPLVDPADQEEERRTRFVLDTGLVALALACVRAAVAHPVRWLRAAALAWRFGRRSGRWLKSPVYLAEACLLVKWLRQERVTHLHVHFGTNSADVGVLTRALGGPRFSFTVHGPTEFDRPEALSLGDKIARCAYVVAISSFGRSQLYRWCRPAEWSRVQVVRCGLDAAFLERGPQPLPPAPRMVCVGRLVEQKGQLLLVDAVARLAAQGIEFELVLAGDGPMRPQIEAAIKTHRLEGRVRITGWLSNEAVRAEMLAARLVVLASFAEGLPVVLMEALALGRPVVTTYVAGIPELVRDGVNGWLVPAGDPAALADVLAHALRATPDQLGAMGRAGSEAVRAAHDARQEAKKLVELFRSPQAG